MNTFDLAVAVLFFFNIALGVKRGFVREAFSLGTWIVAGGVAWTFADDAGRFFSSSVKEPTLQPVVGFILLFVITFIVGFAVSRAAHKMMLSKPWLKFSNFLLGGLVGGVRGAFIIIVMVLLIGLTGLPAQDWWRKSVFAPRLAELGLMAAKYLPRDVSKHISYT